MNLAAFLFILDSRLCAYIVDSLGKQLLAHKWLHKSHLSAGLLGSERAFELLCAKALIISMPETLCK